MSMVKKAAAGIQDGNNTSPYNKAIYQDKRIVETLDKHILAKAEGSFVIQNCVLNDILNNILYAPVITKLLC